ncbi:GTPase HflX [Anaerosalibacter bizertensis]|uniref:GTPase HflX n=2 Tax=Anaerosalibacter bizertensis TaxID=932217 RepID=A0A9Q4ABM4_9FIRM|nr:GTPase HflX [Anaerosalibacter bizertensis]MBV1817907.1 GTPase HflX [Bacteroidales bacterium MSK.15.36]MCB5559474.1 GTPase HflX [Anaerosalibacter bizertensis]MCG4564732.1 GTPase HflX [Anaerosalibacter bizertensis]MCG4583411.1 GTPase HflX [Anaerosalibacter bizertensis]
MVILTEESKERILVVGIDLGEKDFDIEDSMKELEELVEAANGQVIERIVQRREKINAAYYIGKGKANEIKNYCYELNIDTVVFNDELSPAQIKNLENIIERKIIDRTNLILDIFAKRASSKEGQLQVELAQLKYRLPRLIGLRDYLSREGGGIGTRGPGEQKLETDRRHILREIDNIEKQLKDIKRTRDVKRKRREKTQLPIVALVGYTNAGKSTLLNKIIELNENYDEGKKVFVYDMLFATLDTSLRKGILPNGQSFLITDTVGFVSKLPTDLVEAFKGTLEEVKYADLLLHVVDASNKNLDLQMATTYNILKDLKVIDKPIITVFNKMDKVEDRQLIYDTKYVDKKIFTSAKNGKNIDKLLDMIQENIPINYIDTILVIPYDKQDVLSHILDNYNVEYIEHKEEGTEIKVELSSIDYEKYFNYIKNR